MSAPSGLHDGPSLKATLFNRADGLFQAGMILATLYGYGIPHAVWVQLTHPNPLSWLNPVRWRNLIVEAGLPKLLKLGDTDSGHLKRAALDEYAKGRVLELGAGTGLSLQYYDNAAVEEVYLVEPYAKLHPELKENIKAKMAQGYKGKAHIVPVGVEERAKLEGYGVKAGTFDTVVLVQVLCSIPDREKHLPYLQSLLKPGGQLLLFEHVASEDRLTERIQMIYNPVWTTLSMGCNVNRHSGNLVKSLGGWSEVQMRVPDGQHGGSLFPRVVARYVKA